MKNTQRIWILYAILLSLNCLIAEERLTAAKIHLIINAAKLIQRIHFKNALTSKFKSKDRLLGKRISACVSTENQKLRIPSRLIWFDQARPPEAEMIQPYRLQKQGLGQVSIMIPMVWTSPSISRKQFRMNDTHIPKYCL
ncbi:hypothetical protein I79_022183 [Cricetulus griseus]|uniref:Uncharacterized protein n=1 Tax=Cricetulus griseus TaxID=10029 RepID=G3IEN2_CRIGR|nr:hypothetical protein I79_022183 [Cricetulus griseus]